MMNICAKNQGNRGGSCILGVSVLQKVTLKVIVLSPELIALPLTVVGLLHTRDFITVPFYFIVA